MATAKYSRVEVKPAQPAVIEEGINLSLSMEEGNALMAVLNLVGGHPQTTRRKFIDEIRMALWDTHRLTEYNQNDVSKTERSIYFLSPDSPSPRDSE